MRRALARLWTARSEVALASRDAPAAPLGRPQQFLEVLVWMPRPPAALPYHTALYII